MKKGMPHGGTESTRKATGLSLTCPDCARAAHWNLLRGKRTFAVRGTVIIVCPHCEVGSRLATWEAAEAGA